jgi:hypothetical protein
MYLPLALALTYDASLQTIKGCSGHGFLRSEKAKGFGGTLLEHGFNFGSSLRYTIALVVGCVPAALCGSIVGSCSGEADRRLEDPCRRSSLPRFNSLPPYSVDGDRLRCESIGKKLFMADDEFLDLITAENLVDLERLRDNARHGIPPHIRGQVYKFLLGIESADRCILYCPT